MPDHAFEVAENGGASEVVSATCETPEEMRNIAIRALTDAARDRLPKGGEKLHFKITVRNESGDTLYSAMLSLVGAWHRAPT